MGPASLVPMGAGVDFEANDRRAMSNGLRLLFARIARGLNEVMQSDGARLADRYHEHILETPAETRNALLYVVGNRGVHLLRWRKPAGDDFDPFSSLVSEELIQPPQCWLLQKGWLGPPLNAARGSESSP